MEMHGKRKLYMLFLYSVLQPIIMWWLTSYLVPISAVTMSEDAGGLHPIPQETGGE